MTVGPVPPAHERSLTSRAISATLRHPIVMVLKAPVKNAWWAFKGRGVTNPPLPSCVTSVLFVCLGNICRSPFAARLAERRLTDAGIASLQCASAGISTRQSGRTPAHGCAVAEELYGISLVDHRPQLLTAALIDAFDLVVVMDVGQLTQLRTSYPHASARVVLLSLFDPDAVSGYDRVHIDDPFSQSRAVFEACYRRIDRAVARLLADIAPRHTT